MIVEKAPTPAPSKGGLKLVCGRNILTNEQVNILSVSTSTVRGKCALGERIHGEYLSPKGR